MIIEVRRIGRLEERLERLTRGASGKTIEAMLDAHLEKVFQVEREVDELAARTAILEGRLGGPPAKASRPDGTREEPAKPDS